MEIEGRLSTPVLVGLSPVSAVTQQPNKNHIAFLESLKEALQKCDFEGQIPVPMCIRHQDKVTTATAAGPIPFITENRRGRPKPRKGRKGKR